MAPTFIPIEAETKLDWLDLTDALWSGHIRPRAELSDTFLYRDRDTMLSRAAWIDGLGLAVKTATVFPGNTAYGTPNINGAVSLFDDKYGTLAAVLDFHLVTKWKTAGDSLLAARQLARPDSRVILILGAGTVAGSLHEAYSALFPAAEFLIWNRTLANAETFANARTNVSVVEDLSTSVASADIITSATMSTEPILNGEWLKPGQHIDLIGAYRPDMREADDAVLKRARIFTDSFASSVDHIGEFKIPLAHGTIDRADLIADYYDRSSFKRRDASEITLFKNAGGAHLDLMTSRYILETWST